MPETKETRVETVEELKAKLDEAQKVIEMLNKRLTKMIKLYNTITELYMQEETK